MIRRALAAAVLAAAVVLPLTACGQTDDTTRVCVDRSTGLRVDDYRCGHQDSHLGWYFVPIAYAVGVGQAQHYGSYTRPQNFVPSKAKRVPVVVPKPAKPAPPAVKPPVIKAPAPVVRPVAPPRPITIPRFK